MTRGCPYKCVFNDLSFDLGPISSLLPAHRVQEEVLGFQVPVDDVMEVAVLDSGDDLVEEPSRFIRV